MRTPHALALFLLLLGNSVAQENETRIPLDIDRHSKTKKVTQIQFPWGLVVEYGWTKGKITSKTYSYTRNPTNKRSVKYADLPRPSAEMDSLSLSLLEIGVFDDALQSLQTIPRIQASILSHYSNNDFLFYRFLYDVVHAGKKWAHYTPLLKVSPNPRNVDEASLSEGIPALTQVLLKQVGDLHSRSDAEATSYTQPVSEKRGSELRSLTQMIKEIGRCTPALAKKMTKVLLTEKVARSIRTTPKAQQQFSSFREKDASYEVHRSSVTRGPEMVIVNAFLPGRNEFERIRTRSMTDPMFLETYFGDKTIDLTTVSEDPKVWSKIVLAHEFAHVIQTTDPRIVPYEQDFLLLKYLRELERQHQEKEEKQAELTIGFNDLLKHLHDKIEGPYMKTMESSATFFALDNLAECL